MLGVMNLVDAVRSRIPGSITGSFARLNAQSNANGQDAPRMQSVDRSNRQLDADARAAQATGQPTASMSVSMTPDTAGSPPSLTSPGSPDAGVSPRTGMPMPTFTDKIPALTYPRNRTYSPRPEATRPP